MRMLSRVDWRGCGNGEEVRQFALLRLGSGLGAPSPNFRDRRDARRDQNRRDTSLALSQQSSNATQSRPPSHTNTHHQHLTRSQKHQTPPLRPNFSKTALPFLLLVPRDRQRLETPRAVATPSSGRAANRPLLDRVLGFARQPPRKPNARRAPSAAASAAAAAKGKWRRAARASTRCPCRRTRWVVEQDDGARRIQPPASRRARAT